jgi:dGTPase
MLVGADAEHRSATVEGQIARVADLVAYVNHDIDDAVRAGLIREEDLPADASQVVGHSSSDRIGRMVSDIVIETLRSGLTEVRMSDDVLEATLALRSYLFEAVYENATATAEFSKARGILGGLWHKVRESPEAYVDRAVLATDGLDVAVRDFIAGMTDRYAVRLFEQLFVPKPWVSLQEL